MYMFQVGPLYFFRHQITAHQGGDGGLSLFYRYSLETSPTAESNSAEKRKNSHRLKTAAMLHYRRRIITAVQKKLPPTATPPPRLLYLPLVKDQTPGIPPNTYRWIAL